MSKKIYGNLINLILFGGYVVFCWYYSYLKPNYSDLSFFLEALKFLGIFLAARMGTAIFHQAGHAFFAVFSGFRIMYFEACFFKFWYDGEKTRFALFFDIQTLFSGTVMVRLKDAFDSAGAFKKNRKQYSRFILGGFIFNIAAVAAAVVIYSLCLAFHAVFSPLFLVSLAVMLSCWYMIYNAFNEDMGKRGDFISYTKARSSEDLIVALAAQSIVEDVNHGFLFKEAQNVIAFKIKNGLPWLDRYAMNTLSAIAFYACAGKAEFETEIEAYLLNEFFNKEKTPEREYREKIMTVVKIKNFVAFYALKYGRERALELLETAEGFYKELRLRDNALYVYFCDMREALQETLDASGMDTLSYTKFMASDSYAMGFKNFRDTLELAEDNVHQAVYKWHDSK